jgi:uncharacterized protein (TIGR02145 family)
MKKLLFSVCAALAIWGCGGDDGDLPCLGCEEENYYNDYGYCRYYSNECRYMRVYECHNYYGGISYGNDDTCGERYYPNYGYCSYYNGCEYMSINECYNRGGSNYGDDSNCGGNYSYGYCYLYDYDINIDYGICEYMSVNDCYNINNSGNIGGIYFGNDNTCGGYYFSSSSSSSLVPSSSSSARSSSSLGSSYGYCSYYNGCEYMSVDNCYYYGGIYYGDDYTCGVPRVVVIYGSPVTYEGETYQTVVIGTQTWFAKNLNYNPGTGNSACYDCTAYGRLYDWSTAMGFESSCNSSYCSSQIQSKHRGICPSGWHIPNNDDWNVLMDNVGGSSTAGKHLKSKSGWNPYSGIENLDTYGFSALPGGYSYSDGSFDNVGDYGFWWSASEYNSEVADYRYMYYNYDYAYWLNNNKGRLFSVRCVQD